MPKIAFAHFLNAAFNAPEELKILPFTSNQEQQAKLMVSLLMRPMVCPEVKGVLSKKSMEVRFFCPGEAGEQPGFCGSHFWQRRRSVSCQNDAALDTEHWTGHTGCVILRRNCVR